MDSPDSLEIRVEAACLAWRPSSPLAALRRLEGGMSADLFLAELEDGSQCVARFPSAELAGVVASPAEHELLVLAAARRAGLPAPAPYWAGDGLLLMEFLPGTATANPADPDDFVRQMASALARIHAADASHFQFLPPTRVGFVPEVGKQREDLREAEVVQALAKCAPQRHPAAGLRHGDFWAGNVLWQNGRLTGIIDWENALLGPPIADLALSRLDIAWILGFAAMEEFTGSYLADNPIEKHDWRYWNLRAAWRSMGNVEEWAAPNAALDRPDITPGHMVQVLLEFIEQALRLDE